MNAKTDDHASGKLNLFVPYSEKPGEEYMCAAQKEHFEGLEA
jgi:hypothetical protein